MVVIIFFFLVFFFFKQKTAYEMRISDWSSDVRSSDLSATEDFAAGRRRLQRRTRAALTATGDQAKVDDVVELIQDLTRESVSGQVFTIVRSGRAYEGVRDSKSLQPAADPGPARPSQHHMNGRARSICWGENPKKTF